MKNRKVYLHPVGCPKANVDLEKIGWLLQQKGFLIVESPEGADAAIVFGCGFVDEAKQESISDILSLADLKGHGRLGHVVVVGCLPQKYARSLCLSLPEVDSFVGNSWLGMLPGIIGDACDGRLAVKTYDDGVFPIDDAFPQRLQTHGRAWTRTVLIGDGCDNACTYCSIPHMRGALRSRAIPHILKEVDLLVEQGAREIVLAGQDTASYGKDMGKPELATLLGRLAERNPGVWIRLSYTNPDNLDDEVCGVMAEYANICDYIDLPIQHASPRILKAMGRKDRPELLAEIIRKLREAVPDIAVRTSVIVGFPGETETDMEELLAFLRETGFDMVGVFAFSPQPGTPAAELARKVPVEVAQERIVDVVSLQDEISRLKMETFVGRELEVLVEDPLDTGESMGRSQYDMAEVDRTIRLVGCTTAPGSFTNARITSVSGPYEWTAT